MLWESQEVNILKTIKQSVLPREWLFINISSPTARSLGSRKHWLLTVDDCDNVHGIFLSKLPDKANKLKKELKEIGGIN